MQSPHQEAQTTYVLMYAGIVAVVCFFTFLRATAFVIVIMRSSHPLHDAMLVRLLRLPVSFFDTNPVGRILNRFSTDMDVIDAKLPTTNLDFLAVFVNLLAVLAIICVADPLFLIPLLSICITISV